jgi:hypothetical protein
MIGSTSGVSSMEAPTADSLQAIGGLFPAADAGLWVLDQIAPGEDGWAATLLNREGIPVGRLMSPESGRPVSFGREHVTTISKDDDGLVRLSVYRIHFPAGAGATSTSQTRSTLRRQGLDSGPPIR